MFRKKRSDADFQAEIEAHVELEATRLREQGFSGNEAQAAAWRAFGNRMAAQERFYEHGRWVWFDGLRQDLRLAVRLLVKTPGWTAVTAVTATLGIGAAVAMFSVVYSILLRPLPFAEPDNLYAVIERIGRPPGNMSLAPDYFTMRENLREFTGMAAHESMNVTWSGDAGSEQWTASAVSASFFAVLGVQPIHGRVFRADEDQPGSDAVAILSYTLWRQRFGGDPAIVGQSLRINRRSLTVVGIMPKGFDYPRAGARPSQLWVPLALDEKAQRQRASMRGVVIIARGRRGIGLPQVNAELERLTGIVRTEYPPQLAANGFLDEMRISAVPLSEQMSGKVRPLLYVFSGAVALMLLIVCFNVANLMLARASARQREMAVRLALGAPRRRIVRQLITEGLLISILGGGLGLGLAALAIRALTASRQLELAGLPPVVLDGAAAWFALGLTGISGLAFGLAPAFASIRLGLREALQRATRSSSAGRGLRRTRQALVVAQLGLSLTLLIGAGLLTRSFWGLLDIDPGFRTDNVLTARFQLSGPEYASAGQQLAFSDRLTEEVSRLPGIDAAAVTTTTPMAAGGLNGLNFRIQGRPEPSPEDRPNTLFVTASDNFLEALSVPLLAGRWLNARDTLAAPRAIVVNQTFRNRFFPGVNPIGQRISFRIDLSEWMEIVGVAGDIRQFGLDREVEPTIYQSMRQQREPFFPRMLVVRTSVDPRTLAASLASILREIDRDLPLFDVLTLQDRLADSFATRRFNAVLIGSFALVAVFLAAVGVYGVMSYLVALRAPEMGIRRALGARPAQLIHMVLREGAVLGAIGATLGIFGALALNGFLTTLLFGVSPYDQSTFAAFTSVLLATVLAASYIPARRAAAADPSTVLRHD